MGLIVEELPYIYLVLTPNLKTLSLVATNYLIQIAAKNGGAAIYIRNHGNDYSQIFTDNIFRENIAYFSGNSVEGGAIYISDQSENAGIYHFYRYQVYK